MCGKEIRTSGEESVDVLLAELDEQLRQAMSVQPSEDFARQVRARIAEQRRRGDWWEWRWAAAAACVLAIAIGWRMANTPEEERLAPPTRSRSADVRLAAAPAPTVRIEPQVQRRAAVPRRTTTAQTNQPADAMSLEIIVPEDNARAVARLLALARSGGIDEEKLTPIATTISSPTLDVSPLGVAAIAIPDIEIENGPPTGADREE